MIYIFQGVQSICSLPGLACQACAECCKSINCQPCFEGCQWVSSHFKHFLERPLSTFVAVSIVMGLCAILLGDIKDQVLGVINIAFAFFFQYKVWEHIMEKKDTIAADGWVPKQTVQEAFKTVFLEDLLVLAMFVILVIAIFATEWGGVFFSVAAVYAVSWYFCACCAGSVQIKDESERGEALYAGVPANQQMAHQPVQPSAEQALRGNGP